MNLSMLERRVFPRTRAYLPINVRYLENEGETPAHLLDLSCGGAGLLTTSGNAPSLGQYLRMKFEVPTNDGAAESAQREELALVVNIRQPERGVARFGVRFIHQPDINTGLSGPKDILSDHRKSKGTDAGLFAGRWGLTTSSRRRESDLVELATSGAAN